MSDAVRKLEPSSLWNHFSDLNAVPRPSKKEERVIQFMVDFAKSHNLDHLVDDIGNVIIKKPATAGMESRQTIVLQSHLDMVHQKNGDTIFDFDKEGIKMLHEEDWVRADGTTLGADNGIGVATIMAVLSSDSIKHPEVEALFTIDEETGMTGALGLKGGLLKGTILLNLDTEDDDELTIGCAGGIDVTARGNYPMIDTPANSTAFKISITGLNGGHSGMDIHKGLGNANKLMNRVLLDCSKTLQLFVSSIDGGGLRNAIPRESMATVVVYNDHQTLFQEKIKGLKKTLTEEYSYTDSDFSLDVEKVDKPASVISPDFLHKFLRSIYACPNGIYRMTPEIKDLVQTSNNVARVLIGDGKYEILCLTRSSVDSEKADLAQAISSTFELIGAEMSSSGSYPGWTPKPGAPIIKMMTDLYSELFNEQPHVNACHAGLECGILGTNYPGMDMISFGPNIRGAHSPDERVQVSSVQKYWKYFLSVLERIPEKN
jgi:dipeptidase D